MPKMLQHRDIIVFNIETRTVSPARDMKYGDASLFDGQRPLQEFVRGGWRHVKSEGSNPKGSLICCVLSGSPVEPPDMKIIALCARCPSQAACSAAPVLCVTCDSRGSRVIVFMTSSQRDLNTDFTRSLCPFPLLFVKG